VNYHGRGDTSIALKREEIDLALTRNLTENIKMFAGYKVQNYVINVDTKIQMVDPAGLILGDERIKFDMQNTIQMPAIGLGVIYPLTQKFASSMNIGVGYVIPTVKTNVDGKVTNIETDKSLSYFGDINVSLLMGTSFIMQVGYKMQIYNLKIKEEGWGGSSRDTFQGFTLAAIMLF
jgi:hypothetical protein